MKGRVFCITNWNALLRIERFPVGLTKEYKGGLFIVSDPACKDAGQFISGDEIKAIIKLRQP
jgi:hypothetical protein